MPHATGGRQSRGLGFDHERLTYRHLGLDFKLTGVEPARVVPDLLA